MCLILERNPERPLERQNEAHTSKNYMYGILISLGILTSILVSQHLVRKDEKNEDILWDLALWAIIFGVIGARIYHVIDFFGYYRNNPIEMFKVWNGGLGIYGAVVPAVVVIIWILHKKHERIAYWLCNIGTTAPLAQAIGRLGNYFNQELFGKPTTLPWGIFIESSKRPKDYINAKKFHPLFFYESLLDLILFALLFVMWKKTKISRQINFFIYLTGYALIRFFLEFLRINPWTVTCTVAKTAISLNVAQLISIIILVVSMIFIFKFIKRKGA